MNRYFACLLLISSALAHPDYSDSWEEFKQTYEKEYESEMEEAYRQQVWMSSVHFITSHNEAADHGEHSFRVGENHLADMTSDEIIAYMNGLVFNATGVNDEAQEITEQELRDLPGSVDWREKGYVTHIKDQKHCGSCWAFSAVGSMEGAHFKKTGKLVSLSEQNLVDCSKKEGNLGCLGGLMDKAFNYVIENKGIDTESSYPYLAITEKQCKYNTDNIGATITSFKDIPTGSEADLAAAVASVGPVSVGIDASRPTFHFYKSGVYHDKSCSSTHLDHGVLVVGYGQQTDDNGHDQSYWIVKNSWGVKWGQKGYIQMAKDKNNACGIAKQASYPIA